MDDGVYRPQGEYEQFAEIAEERRNVTGITMLKEETEKFLSEKPEERQQSRVGPVSYTHLDVYKRQMLCGAVSAWNVCTCGVGGTPDYHLDSGYL